MTCLSSLDFKRRQVFLFSDGTLHFETKGGLTMRKVHIFDTTLRDGEQAPGTTVTAEQKIRIAEQLARLGVDCIEPGFPFSSVGEFESVRAISRKLQGSGVEICGFARAVRGDISTARSRRRMKPKDGVCIFFYRPRIFIWTSN
jgi:isopropylmalate/homocitrate/citramalate synthase